MSVVGFYLKIEKHTCANKETHKLSHKVIHTAKQTTMATIQA